MGNTERFVDSGVFVPVRGPMPPPRTVGGLLQRLDVQNEPEPVQNEAIRRWLAENQPTDDLAWMLRRDGRGHLLPPQQSGD
jgi:hypothetical protein